MLDKINKSSTISSSIIFDSKVPNGREGYHFGNKILSIKPTGLISYFKIKLNKFNEKKCNEKNIKIFQAPNKYIDSKLNNIDISNKSLKKLEKKISKMNKRYLFSETHDEMSKIKYKVSHANALVRDKISIMLGYKFGINISDKNNNSLNEKKSNIESIEKSSAIISKNTKIDEIDGKQTSIATENRKIEKKNKYTPSLPVIEESIENEYIPPPLTITQKGSENKISLSKINIDKEFGESLKLFSAYRLEHNLNEIAIKKDCFIKEFTEIFFDDFSHLENGTQAKNCITYFQQQGESSFNLRKLDFTMDKIKSNLSRDDFKSLMRNASELLTGNPEINNHEIDIMTFISLLENMNKAFTVMN